MKKFRQYRSNQGRSPERQKANAIGAFIGMVGMIVVLLILILCPNITT